MLFRLLVFSLEIFRILLKIMLVLKTLRIYLRYGLRYFQDHTNSAVKNLRKLKFIFGSLNFKNQVLIFKNYTSLNICSLK